ncbi:MAG: lysophospholipid acyltransferase family protein [Opitutales bacterium]
MTFLYRCAQTIFFLYFKIFHRFRVSGLEHVPSDGAFLLASNHVSFFDPPALGCRVPRDLHYFARKSLFKGLLGKLITAFNSIPVDRESSDVSSFKKALKVLEKGSPLLVFPEGTRSLDGSLQAAKAGVGLIAIKASVPVLPARVIGGFEILGKGCKLPKIGSRLTIVYGPLLQIETLDPGPKTAKRSQIVADAIMEAIGNLGS